jgi:hypothetical protein
MRFGIPYVLRDYNRTYSPKKAHRPKRAMISEQEISLALDGFYEKAALYLGSEPQIILFGIDPSTEYIIRHAQQYGIKIAAICSQNQRYVGQLIRELNVVGIDRLAEFDAPLLTSAFSTLDSRLMKELRKSGYKGRIFSIIKHRETYRTREVRTPNVLRFFTTSRGL